MSDEPDNLILRMLREIRAEMGDMRSEMGDMRSEFRAELRSEINSLRADVASDITALRVELKSDMNVLRNDLTDQIDGLRRMVTHYHSSIVGHGFLISDLEARMHRVEQHLNLPAIESH